MCLNCNWERWYAKIENEILATSRYDFAEDTLVGIMEWIEENEHVTQRQVDAVTNIEESAE